MQWERLPSFLVENQVVEAWLPLHDNHYEGEWRDYYDPDQVLNYTLPWMESEPNGGTSENCVTSGKDYDSNWTDSNCDANAYCICERDPLFHLELRGLCADSAIDRYFRPANNFSNVATLHLIGYQDSLIEYNVKSKIWMLSSTGYNVSGVSHAAHHTFALGKHEWSIVGDSGCSKRGKRFTLQLKLTGCDTGHFTCNDGQCVTMEQRCNQLPDCRDRSDETNCKVLVLDNEYNKNVPPVSVDKGIKEVTNVSVSIDVLNLVDID